MNKLLHPSGSAWEINGQIISPNSRFHGILNLANVFADGQSLEIPYIVVRGASPGKTLYVQVAQHGIEVMGIDSIRRLMAELDPATMQGTLIYCLPNPLSFREKNRSTQFDPKPGGMNRVWPGNPRGSIIERMADLIWRTLVAKADAVIDLHTAARHCPLWVFYESGHYANEQQKIASEKAEQMAHLFAAPVLYQQMDSYGERKTLRARCIEAGIPAIVPELGAEGHFDNDLIEAGLRGIKNIMMDMGIISGLPAIHSKPIKLQWRADHTLFTVSVNTGGIFIPEVKIGDVVKKDSRVGFVYSPRTFQEIEVMHSPTDGCVFSIRENPVVHLGDVVMAIPEILPS